MKNGYISQNFSVEKNTRMKISVEYLCEFEEQLVSVTLQYIDYLNYAFNTKRFDTVCSKQGEIETFTREFSVAEGSSKLRFSLSGLNNNIKINFVRVTGW